MAKIAHIANLYGPKSGGLKTAMNSMAQEYQKFGHEVMLIVPGEKDLVVQKPFGTVVEIKAPIIPFSGGYRIIFNTARLMRRLIIRYRQESFNINDESIGFRVCRN